MSCSLRDDDRPRFAGLPLSTWPPYERPTSAQEQRSERAETAVKPGRIPTLIMRKVSELP